MVKHKISPRKVVAHAPSGMFARLSVLRLIADEAATGRVCKDMSVKQSGLPHTHAGPSLPQVLGIITTMCDLPEVK